MATSWGEKFERAGLRVSSAITGAVAIVSPERAIKRNCAMAMYMKQRGFGAADINRFTSNVRTSILNADSELNGRRGRITSLVRDELMNNPTAACMIQTFANNVCGDAETGRGITFSAAVRDSEGKIDAEECTALNAVWERFKDRLNYDGSLGFGDMLRLLQNSLVQTGEALAIMRPVAGATGGELGLSVQVLEPDRLPMDAEFLLKGESTTGGTYGSGINGVIYYAPGTKTSNLVRHGIERNDRGIPVAYHILADHPGDKAKIIVWPRVMRIEARFVIHYFRADRPEQTRGVSPLVPGLRMMQMQADLLDYELKAASLQAMFGANVKGGGTLGYDDTDLATDAGLTDVNGEKVTRLRPGLITQGEEMTFYQGNRPGGTFLPFMQSLIRAISSGSGMSYEAASRDFSQGAYSAQRQAANEDWRNYATYQGLHVRHFGRRVWAAFVESALISGLWRPAEGIEAFNTERWRFVACRSQVPGPQHINPLQEIQALAIGLANNIYCLDEVCEASELTPEERIQRAADLKTMAEGLGLTMGWASGQPKPPVNFAAAASASAAADAGMNADGNPVAQDGKGAA